MDRRLLALLLLALAVAVLAAAVAAAAAAARQYRGGGPDVSEEDLLFLQMAEFYDEKLAAVGAPAGAGKCGRVLAAAAAALDRAPDTVRAPPVEELPAGTLLLPRAGVRPRAPRVVLRAPR